MSRDPTGLHHRRSVRLPTYDYAGPGLYFVTVCIHALFGAVTDEEMRLNGLGRIADEEWRRTPSIRAEVVLDGHIVMPNHVHLLFGIVGVDRAGPANPPTPDAFPVGATRCVALPGAADDAPGRPAGPVPGSVGAIVGQYKSAASRRINEARGTPGTAVWQRGYHERVVRDEDEAYLIRRYVAENPLRWHLDRYHVGGR